MTTSPVSPDQVRLLQVAYDVFRGSATWPVFQFVETKLAREKIDAWQVLRTTPPAIVIPPAAFLPPAEGDQISVKIRGLTLCDRSERDLELFLGSLQLLVKLGDEFEPSPTEAGKILLTSAMLREALTDVTEMELAKIYRLFIEEPIRVSGGYTTPAEWELRLSPRGLTPFEGVAGIDDYLAALPQPEVAQAPDEAAHAQEMSPSDPANPGPWEPNRLRVFISHVHMLAGTAHALKDALASYAIDAFVAHDDIEPTRKWEEEIAAALSTCDALVALLSPDFVNSKWTDQEVGWVVGRSSPLVASVNLGATPHGFIGRYQAIPGHGGDPVQIAPDLFKALLTHDSTSGPIADALVSQFEDAFSYDEARRTFDLLAEIPAFSQEQLEHIRDAYKSNNQLNGSFYVKAHISGFLQVWDGPPV